MKMKVILKIFTKILGENHALFLKFIPIDVSEKGKRK